MWKLAPVLLETTASRQPHLGINRNPIVFYDTRRNHLPYQISHLQQQPGLQPQDLQSPAPGQQSSPLTQCVWTFFWLAVLIFIAYPIGLLSCELYVLLSPISAICSCFSVCTNFLLRIAHLPLTCTNNMIQAKPLICI